MRMLSILAMSTVLALAAPSYAQQPAAPQANTPEAQSQTPVIRALAIVDIQELPPEAQSQVNEIVAQQGDDALQELRGLIDGNAEIKAALEAKGLNSGHVIAANVESDGTLVLVTKKAS
ncbi:hypothetical protein [Rhodoligotrophos defluvii]|uniref:hypothetical protein n=1 Tax=Rhodoligotrophos defluvii TaxID=2561934 RepID=UPI001485BE22|nr:hypothetical protein [Rhodoligotrophos defluvii]